MSTAGGAGGSSTRTSTETEGRVYNVGGQDWDEIVAAAAPTATAGTWR
jgi:hypothetical protein